MSIKPAKYRPLEQIARKFWDDLVSTILVPAELGYSPSMGEMLSAYNDMKSRHPECECIIQQKEKRLKGFFQSGDTFSGIRIIRKFHTEKSAIELIQTISTYYVRFQYEEIDSFSHTVNYCDISQTMKNFENFIENFPQYMEKFERKRLDFEKRLKIEKMTECSIRASVSQILEPMGYGWSLTERERDYLLQIFAPGTQITLTLNAKNFAARIAALPRAIVHVESLFSELNFPIDISKKI